jgi:dolichol kinase
LSNVKASAAVREFFEKITGAAEIAETREEKHGNIQAIPFFAITGSLIFFLFSNDPSMGMPTVFRVFWLFCCFLLVSSR